MAVPSLCLERRHRWLLRAKTEQRPGLATASETVHDKTTAGMKPNMPRDLTAELARDTNLSGVGNQGVLLQWNQPASVPGAPVNAYKVERSKDGGDYEVLASSSTADPRPTTWTPASRRR